MRNRTRTEALRVSGIEAELTFKDVKRFRMRVLPPDGRVAVSAPHGSSRTAIVGFVERNYEWILKAQEKVRQPVPGTEPLADGGRVHLWGSAYRARFEESARASAKVLGEEIVLSGADDEARVRALDALYRRELQARLPGLHEYWSGVVGRSAASFKLRRMKTRWGTCNTRTAAITLNLSLAERPPSALHYVLVHELTHLLERGHGPRFKALMDGFLPGWRHELQALARPQ